MNAIVSCFDFSQQSIWLILARFGIELSSSVVLAYLVVMILLLVFKGRKHSIGFSNWFKMCWLYGINMAIALVGVLAILTISYNGLCYFSKIDIDIVNWAWYCGYILMMPELVLIACWLTIYWVLNKQINNSIKR